MGSKPENRRRRAAGWIGFPALTLWGVLRAFDWLFSLGGTSGNAEGWREAGSFMLNAIPSWLMPALLVGSGVALVIYLVGVMPELYGKTRHLLPALFLCWREMWGRLGPNRDRRSFDTPIREAVDHYVRTFPHSYKDGADQHAFEVFHKAMCNGELPVMGAKDEDAAPERLSTQQCKLLKPIMACVPKNWASPQGVRFDLFESVGPSPPLEESAGFLGYTGLRVRSADLYRLWPKNREAAETLESPWHEALERCHAAFLEYMKVPASSPISNEEIAATQAFLPHVHELCRLLDKQGIPHPDIPDGLIFDDTGKWGDFMARLLAVRGDIDEARTVKEKAS